MARSKIKISVILMLLIFLLAVTASTTFASHFWPYVPSCIYPVHGSAEAIYSTGFGSHTIQFHGSALWSGSNFCPYSGGCTWHANADLIDYGDEVWLNSVTAPVSSHISAWCSTGIPTDPVLGREPTNGSVTIELLGPKK